MSTDKSKLIYWNPHLSHSNSFVVVSSSLRLYESKPIDQPWKNENLALFRANSILSDKPAVSSSSTNPIPQPLTANESLSDARETEKGINLSQYSAVSPSSLPPSVSPVPSLSRSFRLLDSIAYPQQSIKCVAWSRDARDPLLIGGGLLSGRLVLMKFLDELKVVKEFIPRYARACNVIAWNPIQNQQIAVGLDRVRNGCGTLIWDINQRGSLQAPSSSSFPIGSAASFAPATSLGNNLFSINANRPIESVSEPLGRVSNSEATLALSWLPNDAYSLAVGTGFKWLRIYDIRGNSNSSRPISVVAHSKSVFGAKFEPANHNRLATHSEDGIVKLWDLRSLRGPIFSLHTSGSKAIRSKPLAEVDWCETSPALLATIAKDEDFLRLWDLSGSLPIEQSEIERLSQLNETGATEIPPSRKHSSPAGALAALSWHPTIKQRLLTITSSGIVEDLSFHDNVPVSWSPDNLFSFAVNEFSFVGQRNKSAAPEDQITEIDSDIASVMKLRAQRGYSIDVATNERICNENSDSALARVWKQILVESQGTGRALPKQGICEILSETNNETSGGQAAAANQTVEVLDPECSPSIFRSFSSPQRSEILRRCGWFACVGGKSNPTRKEFEIALRSLEEAGEFERAAFLAIFHLDLRRALTSLTSAAGSDLALVAMALSGYSSFSSGVQSQNSSSESISLWSRSWFANLQQEKMSKYLRAIFSFLSSSANKPGIISYRSVLDDGALELSDRIGFACRFLPDADLHQWLASAVKSCADTGSLSGLLLSGAGSRDGIELLQSYLDHSADIQTVAILSVYSQAVSLLQNPGAEPDSRLNNWISIYKNLLNQWRLWGERAKFDVARALTLAQLNEVTADAGQANSQSAVQTQSAASLRSAKSKAILNLRPQVYARCNFCGQSLKLTTESANSSKSGQSRGAGGFRPRARIGASKSIGPEVSAARVKGCPSCSKSLPRCSLCLVALDAAVPGPISTSAAGSVNRLNSASGMRRNVSNSSISSSVSGDDLVVRDQNSSASLSPDNPLFDISSMNNYSRSFCWCQTCRHGGHTGHLAEWFKVHSVCPVSGCGCNCEKQ